MKHIKPNFQRTILFVTFVLISSISISAQGKSTYNVAIFIYQNVELLDFAGPTEVFASTSGFKVYTVSVDGKIFSRKVS